MKHKLIATLLIAFSLQVSAQVANPNVTQLNIRETICKPGWTNTIRVSTVKNKALLCRMQKVNKCSDYILDHIMPLSVGGHPTDLGNLQLQQKTDSYNKDTLERKVKTEVCAGRLTLARGQAMFNKD